MDLDDYTLGEPYYSHTTFDIWEPTIWANERDARDHRDGREDVEPLDDPITQAIGRIFAEENELLTATHHIEIPAMKVENPITGTIVVGSEEAIDRTATSKSDGDALYEVSHSPLEYEGE
jgi:hypothetical protein